MTLRISDEVRIAETNTTGITAPRMYLWLKVVNVGTIPPLSRMLNTAANEMVIVLDMVILVSPVVLRQQVAEDFLVADLQVAAMSHLCPPIHTLTPAHGMDKVQRQIFLDLRHAIFRFATAVHDQWANRRREWQVGQYLAHQCHPIMHQRRMPGAIDAQLDGIYPIARQVINQGFNGAQFPPTTCCWCPLSQHTLSTVPSPRLSICSRSAS